MTPLLVQIVVVTLQCIASSMTKPIDHAASPLELVVLQHDMVHDTLVENDMVEDILVEDDMVEDILVENDMVEDILVQHIMVQAALPGGGSIIWRR